MTALDRPMLVAAICLLVATFLMTFPSHHEFECFSKADGTAYCQGQDGRVFRLREDKFKVQVEK